MLRIPMWLVVKMRDECLMTSKVSIGTLKKIDSQGLQNWCSLTNIISALIHHPYQVIKMSINRKNVSRMKNWYKILIGMHEESRRHCRTVWRWNYEETVALVVI